MLCPGRHAAGVRRGGAAAGAVGPLGRGGRGPAHAARRRLLALPQVRSLLRYQGLYTFLIKSSKLDARQLSVYDI